MSSDPKLLFPDILSPIQVMQDIDNNPIEQMPYLSGLLLKQFIERMA
jgi:hypothetical protein